MTNEKYPVDNQQLEIMQNSLKYIRENIGWTSEQLAMKIGVTKQTISNIETRKTKLTKLHYIAIRTVLDYDIEQLRNEEQQKKIKLLLNILFDNKEFHKSDMSAKKNDLSKLITASTSLDTAIDIVKMIAPAVSLGTFLISLMSSTKKK